MAHEPFQRVVQDSHTAIIMIHGIIGTPDHFLDFIPLVPQNWSIYNILLDGHGAGVRAFAQTSMDKWKRQVSTLVECLASQYDHILIAAHSMGTLFAIEQAVYHQPKICGLFLMGSCLQIGLKPLALINAFKVSTGWIRPDDQPAMAARRACSIDADRRFWQYLGWLPRYWELLREIPPVRRLVCQLQIPCLVLQSRQDEMVSPKASQWFEGYPHIHCSFLDHSTHFHYSPSDQLCLLQAFSGFCRQFCT